MDISNTPTADSAGYNKLISEANSSSITQQQLANQLLAKLQGYNAPYQADIASQVAGAKADTSALGNKYISDVSNASNQLGSSLSDSLTQRIMQANQGNTQALREQLAATGGLQRGGADAAFLGNAANVTNQIGQGNQAIIQQQLAARLGATDTAYGANQGMIGTGLGLNTNASGTVMNNNVNATTNNGNTLLGIEQNRSQNVLGALSADNNQSLASALASKQNTSNLIGSGIGAVGTVVGGMYGGPMGAAAGNRVGTYLGSSLGRGTVNSSTANG